MKYCYFPCTEAIIFYLTWIGDAVPGLVVKMSCQLPSIKLELVCRETMNAKKASFPLMLILNLFRFIGYRHAKVFFLTSLSHFPSISVRNTTLHQVKCFAISDINCHLNQIIPKRTVVPCS
jgi:hypothetical protein